MKVMERRKHRKPPPAVKVEIPPLVLLGQKIRLARLLRGVKIWQLAQVVGCSVATISNAERGAYRTPERLLQRVTARLGLDYAECLKLLHDHVVAHALRRIQG